MFIPNKTFQVIRVTIIGIIAILLMVIAGQSVLYIKKVNENKVTLDSMTAQIDKLATDVQTDFSSTLGRQAQTTKAVTELKQGLQKTQTTVDKLLRNECSTETAAQLLTRDMVIACQTLGVLP